MTTNPETPQREAPMTFDPEMVFKTARDSAEWINFVKGEEIISPSLLEKWFRDRSAALASRPATPMLPLFIPLYDERDTVGPMCGEEFVCSEIDYAPGPDAYGAPTICGMPRGHKGAHIDDSMAGRIAWMTRAEADKAVAETNTSAHDSEVEFLKARIAAYRSVVDELIRLYGWRNERGGAITDDEARQYGREKKAAWESARRVREADK